MPVHKCELALGTVQLGVDYGRVNQSGRPSLDVANKLVHAAMQAGVRLLDTARGYGESEQVLGQILTQQDWQNISLTSKLNPVFDLPENANEQQVFDAVDASIKASLTALNTQYIHTFLLHRWEHRTAYNGAIWQRLLYWRSQGVLGQLGMSVLAGPQEAVEALQDNNVKFIQLPFNILDWRWQQHNIPQLVKKRGDVHIQARSVLLQGLLVNDAHFWPQIAGVDAAQILAQLDEKAHAFSCLNRIDLCYAFVRAQDWIHSIVVGMENTEQLDQNAQLFKRAALNTQQLENLSTLPQVSQQLLNPALWPKD